MTTWWRCFGIQETLKGDDPRNTDNAWLETTVLNFMDDDGIFRLVFSTNQNVSYYQPIRKRENLKSDLHFKTTACWVELRNQDLFASHKLFIGKVAKKYKINF